MDLFEFVKANVDILELVREHTSLKKAGVYWKGHCPFHHERTGSFTVSPHKGIFYCFGCHASGDAIGFTAKSENCPQIDAAKLLVAKYNLQLPEALKNRDQTQANLASDKQHFKTCEIVALWCQKNLLPKTAAYQYLVQNRQITPDTIDQFKIGYFPEGPNGIKALIKFANTQQILVSDLVQAGVLIQTKTNTYSPFENRVIFPITDYLGRYCGFGGRVFLPDDQRAKYYNSRENRYFNKGSLLFGLDKARKAIQAQDQVFLVEGYTDCVALYQHGYQNVVAILGTACTSEHIKLLARFCTQIQVLYDSDAAGQQAILRLTELCWNFNIEVKVINLPAGADPASFLASGESLEPAIAAAQDIYQFIVTQACQSVSNENLAHKVQGIEKLINIINTVPDQLKRSLLLEAAASSLGLPIESLRAKAVTLSSAKSAGTILPAANNSSSSSANSGALDALAPTTNLQIDPLERKIFAILIHQPELFHHQYLPLFAQLTAPLNQLLVELVAPSAQRGFGISSASSSTSSQTLDTKLAQSINKLEPAMSDLIRQIIMSDGTEVSAEAFKQLMLLFLQKRWKTIISQTKQQITSAQHNLDQAAVAQTMAEFQKLKMTLLGEIK